MSWGDSVLGLYGSESLHGFSTELLHPPCVHKVGEKSREERKRAPSQGGRQKHAAMCGERNVAGGH